VANYYTAETLQNMLDRNKQRRDLVNSTSKVPNWTNFTPEQLTYQPPAGANEMYKRMQEGAVADDQIATNIEAIKAQNRYNYNQLSQAQKQLDIAKQNKVKRNPNPAPTNQPGTPQTGGPAVPTGGLPAKGNWGPDKIPQVWDIQTLNPKAPMVTANFNGMRYTVNSQVAPIFRSFLVDLYSMGYRPKSIGGYNVRNIAGTSTPSLHSYGFAIDIDPTRNPVYRDNNPADDVYALPKSVGALAKKYGLSWGGSWKSYKDYMHFSVPYGGRQ